MVRFERFSFEVFLQADEFVTCFKFWFFDTTITPNDVWCIMVTCFIARNYSFEVNLVKVHQYVVDELLTFCCWAGLVSLYYVFKISKETRKIRQQFLFIQNPFSFFLHLLICLLFLTKYITKLFAAFSRFLDTTSS